MQLLIGLIALVGMVLGRNDDLVNIFNEANDRFTGKFFGEVIKENPEKSIVLSAYSVLFPLAQLATGAEGESHAELLSNIYIPSDNVSKAVFPRVYLKLRKVKGVTLKIAARMYVANGYEPEDVFAAVSRVAFDSDVKSVNFTDNVETAKIINSWVEDQTDNRIKDLVDPNSLDSTTRAILVNAIYFKGFWKDKFDSALTTDRPFYLNKDKSVLVPMMNRKGEYKYGESKELDANILEVGYKGDGASFVIVLPNKIDGLNSLVEKVKETSALTKALKNTYLEEVDVSIPKFKIETTINLKDVLSNIGIKKIFEPSQARLTKILENSDNPLYISEATQKAFIEVNEEGAEAAAANDFGIVLFSGVISTEPIVFKADHPFIFMLLAHDKVLFEGIYKA